MDWLKKHGDTAAILTVLLMAYFWVDSKFDNMSVKIADLQKQVYEIEKDVAIIRTVMIMKNIYPEQMANVESDHTNS